MEISKKPTITCHTGAMGTPDNSLEFVRKAVDWGAEILEIDVTFRPDGTPVIIHKGEPDKNEGVLFSEALAIAAESDKCKINLDLKSTKNLPAVESLVKEYGLYDRVFFTGVSESWVEAVKNNSTIPYYLNCAPSMAEKKKQKAAEALAEKAKALGVIGLNCNYLFVSKFLIDVMHENGLEVSVWTANKKYTMRHMLEFGPDNITTRNPDILSDMMNRIIK